MTFISIVIRKKHVSSFIIQCNWTWVSVYRYLVQQQQKHHAKIAVNTVKSVTRSLMFVTREKYSDCCNKRKYKTKSIYVCVYTKLSRNLGKKTVAYLWSCIVRVSKLRERHSCFFCYHQQYSSPLIDCNQFYFKSTVLHTFPRTAFRSIIDDFTHRRETLGWHQLQIVLYEWIIPPKDSIRNEIKRH